MTRIPDDLPRRILDGADDAVLIADRDGVVRYWNPAAERTFGFPAVEVLGKSLDVIVPERLRGRHWTGWEKVMSSGRTRYGGGQRLAVPALRKNGGRLSVEFSIQLVKDAGGRIEWAVAFLRDVTEREELLSSA